ncbi:YggT family protein [Virgibacillus dakarensis]|uniref:Membrane protein n=1 Tax=Lentibacillus populi TaxID=1827502 RepID=A0A9W5TYH1_9BACI|nr:MULTISPECIES: YggT family protein [Bacillaceae]MBT2216922.1 YggT family protein [Virgibacillus dakarensis]MTW85328.1 YggT family protein [Virgibacillus dakarensis]GGB45265.1 membrane protein [Lentibacillus populi]
MVQLFNILFYAFEIYVYALIIYIFMSWFPGARESTIGVFLAKICEPYLEMFRKFIPPLGMIDLSPIVAIFVLYLARSGLLELFRLIVY